MTCRKCKEYMSENDNYIKTGVRHYSHWNCAIDGKSPQAIKDLLGRLPSWKLETMPWGTYDRIRQYVAPILDARRSQPSGGSK